VTIVRSSGPRTIERQTVAAATTRALREKILSGEIGEGEQLRQDALAAEYGVSRIPLREALRQLEAEGLVSFYPHRGAVVSTLSLAEIEERLLWPPTSVGAPSPRSVEAIIADACLKGLLMLQLHPPTLVSLAGERPVASVVSRWQARRGAWVTNLWHETIRVHDPIALRLLTLLDGSRTRTEIAAAMADILPAPDPAAREERIDEYLRQFGKHGFLTR